MARDAIGKPLTILGDSVYIRIYEDDTDGTLMFSVIDTLDYINDTDRALFMNCLARGMMKIAVSDTEEVVDVGVDEYRNSNPLPADVNPEDTEAVAAAAQPIGDAVVTAEGNVVLFPKTVGNA